MAKQIDTHLELNQANTSLPVFMGNYNLSVPASFPHATTETLLRFQATHQALFKGLDTWSIEKHRKRFMDWMISYHDFK